MKCLSNSHSQNSHLIFIGLKNNYSIQFSLGRDNSIALISHLLTRFPEAQYFFPQDMMGAIVNRVIALTGK
jgi:hypothetical protein